MPEVFFSGDSDKRGLYQIRVCYPFFGNLLSLCGDVPAERLRPIQLSISGHHRYQI
jgi:hypothetical protein